MLTNDILYDYARKYTPNGSQTMSKMPDRYVANYPKIIDSGKGAILTDVEGNSYIDYIAALGPIILGYSYEELDYAVLQQMKKGILFSMPGELEGKVAHMLSHLSPTCEQWKFTKTGSDACTLAVKIARAYTRRDNIVVCGYHGWHDWYSAVNDKRMGIPQDVDKYVNKAIYNDLQSFERLVNKDTACVIMEPQMFETPNPDFLANVQQLCRMYGAILIFDETVTGFRYPDLLAQNYYKVHPDLTIIGKAMGNGYPMAAVGGKRPIMQICENNSFFASTTFGGDCVGLAATLSVLQILPYFMTELVNYGIDLAAVFNKSMKGKATCKGFPTRTMFDFPTVEHKALFWQEACARGVLFGYSNFTMVSHLEEGIFDRTANAIEAAASFVLACWDQPKPYLHGPLPKEVFRLIRK